MSADPRVLAGSRPPLHALMLVADIEGFSSRDIADQMRTREALYEEFRAAFTPDHWAACPHEDRGDGLLVVVPPRIPKAAVLGEFLPRLDRALAGRRRGDPLLRLRIAVHAGDVHFDAHGIGGHAVNRTFRLCDSDPLRAAIRTARGDTALLVSDVVHDDVVRGGYPGIVPTAFHTVDVRVKETAVRAWLHVAGDDETARRVAHEAETARTTKATESAGTSGTATGESPARSGVSFSAGRDLSVADRNMIANGDLTVGRDAPGKHWWRRN